jgi:threonine dehydrogenase-like Zn-dependent dehydrogenase
LRSMSALARKRSLRNRPSDLRGGRRDTAGGDAGCAGPARQGADPSRAEAPRQRSGRGRGYFTRNGQQYDLILDVKSNRSIFAYLRALRPGGAYVTVGGSTSRLAQALLLGPMVSILRKKRVRVVALKPNKDLAYMTELVEAGQVRPVVDGRFTLAEAAEAMRYFGSGSHKGKVVLTVE